jgi:hypothetical protein
MTWEIKTVLMIMENGSKAKVPEHFLLEGEDLSVVPGSGGVTSKNSKTVQIKIMKREHEMGVMTLNFGLYWRRRNCDLAPKSHYGTLRDTADLPELPFKRDSRQCNFRHTSTP